MKSYTHNGLSMERDLKTLRRSRLMNYSEFRTMTTSLERYHKDTKLAKMIGRKETKDLDMRPYLYDEGDSYDKPFYNTLLKMLYKVCTSIYYDKQYEDLKKIFKWYKANKELISSPLNILIPDPQLPTNTTTPELKENDSVSVEGETMQKVPKLHLRPKTAPPIEKKEGIRYVTWNEAQLNTGCKRPASGKQETRLYNHEQYARAQVAKSLKISQIGHSNTTTDRLKTNPLPYGSRPSTAPPYNIQTKLKGSDSLKPYVLKPYTSTPAPMTSPVNSPLTSPRDSPVPFKAKSPHMSAHFFPEHGKDPSVNLSIRLPKGNREKCNKEEQLLNQNDASDNKNSVEAYDDLPSLDHLSPMGSPPNATPSELKQILQNQIHEEKLLEEQHGLLQKKLLHKYDKYAHDCAMSEKERKINVKMIDGGLTVTRNGSSQPSPVVTYDLSSQEIIPNFSRIYSKTKADGHSQSKSSESASAIQSGYSPARHLRHSTVPTSCRPEEVNVNMVLDMVTPIGIQLEHDRERQNGYLVPGMKQPSSTVSISNRPNKPCEPQPLWETSSTYSCSNASSFIQDSPRSGVQTPLELKSNKPELATERNDRDYKVHFQQEKPSEPTKSFKTSGPVSPDTIRYQWTDDGFGNMTYLRKLKSPLSPRTPRKKHTHSQTPRSEQVTMTTGPRCLDKRTVASLMLVRHLGETERRDSDRMGIAMDKRNPAPTPPDPVECKYNMEYMTICQPIGPRLGETEKPSTVAWYLQGDHGLYRDPNMRSKSDEIRIKREVRIPQDRSLIIEGKHIGGETDHHTDTNGPSHDLKIIHKDENTISRKHQAPKEEVVNKNALEEEKTKHVEGASRPKSPLPRRSPSAPSNKNRHISIPTDKGFGTASRPCSARSDRSEKKYAFSVKQFNHFCWPDEALLTEDIIRQREVWAAVNIQRIFRGFMARQYYHTLKDAEKERQRKAALTLQSHLRGFLTRKRMEVRMKEYTPSTRTKEWAKQYKDELKMRESARNQKKNIALIKLNKEAEKQEESIKQVKAHQNIYDIYHPVREGPTKAQMKAAAVVIQRYFRGWFVRRMYQKVKTKALKRTLSFNKFIKSYQSLIYRIQKRYGVQNPTTELQFNELMEYVERLNKYEIAFQKFAVDGILNYNDIKEYFKSVGHMPSQKEIDDAIEIITKSSPKGKSLTKAEAVEILFQIYVPKGTGMKLSDVRKSTWLNPLKDGQDIMQLLSKKELEETNLAKCLALVANSGRENEEIQDLLRPGSAAGKSSKKTVKKGAKERRVTLAQYPLRPSSSSSSRSRSKSPRPKR